MASCCDLTLLLRTLSLPIGPRANAGLPQIPLLAALDLRRLFHLGEERNRCERLPDSPQDRELQAAALPPSRVIPVGSAQFFCDIGGLSSARLPTRAQFSGRPPIEILDPLALDRKSILFYT